MCVLDDATYVDIYFLTHSKALGVLIFNAVME